MFNPILEHAAFQKSRNKKIANAIARMLLGYGGRCIGLPLESAGEIVSSANAKCGISAISVHNLRRCRTQNAQQRYDPERMPSAHNTRRELVAFAETGL